MKDKIIKYLAIIIFISLIIFSIYRYFNQVTPYYETPPDYFQTSQNSFDKMIDEKYTKYSVQKDLPHFSQNSFFEYEIFPSGQAISKIDVYLTPILSNTEITDADFLNTKNEILNWIISKDTLISDIQIDWYIYDAQNDKNIIFDQTNKAN